MIDETLRPHRLDGESYRHRAHAARWTSTDPNRDSSLTRHADKSAASISRIRPHGACAALRANANDAPNDPGRRELRAARSAVPFRDPSIANERRVDVVARGGKRRAQRPTAARVAVPRRISCGAASRRRRVAQPRRVYFTAVHAAANGTQPCCSERACRRTIMVAGRAQSSHSCAQPMPNIPLGMVRYAPRSASEASADDIFGPTPDESGREGPRSRSTPVEIAN